MSDESDLPFKLPGFIGQRKGWIVENYPDQEPSFRDADAVQWLFSDAIRSYVIGCDIASLLCSLACIEKSLAQETGEEWGLEKIFNTAYDEGLIDEEEKDFLAEQAREWYNSSKHYRSPEDERNLENRTRSNAPDPSGEVEGEASASMSARLQTEAEKSLAIIFSVLPRLSFVELSGEPSPFDGV